MNDKFGFSQADDGLVRFARVTVPGCGRNEKDEAPIIIVEQTKDGGLELKVWADIKSTEPTHVIPLNGAKLEKKNG